MIPLGIDPAELNDEAGYLRVGRVLRVDYVLVGRMEKIGNFVEVTFRRFTMPQGIQKQYPGGKTLEIFVQQEIPMIADSILSDVPQLIITPTKKSKWP